MPRYQITLKDRTVETIDGADAYQQEGQMTTFFATREGRDAIDCWSTRLASFRTSEVVIIRRLEAVATMAALTPEPARPHEPSVSRLRSAC